MHTWFCLTNSENTIIACYGGALFSEAQEKARQIEFSTGCAVYLRTVVSQKRPRVFEKLGV